MDKEYILRMPIEKIEKILQYNEQDVVNLYNILSCSTYIVSKLEYLKKNGVM